MGRLCRRLIYKGEVVLTNEELVNEIKQGINTTSNLELLYTQNRSFICKIANRYKGIAELDDLMQEGYLGLYEAVQRYENCHEVLFITYAGYWIAQAIRRYIENNNSSLRLPVHLHGLMYKHKKVINAYQSQLGRKPTDRELCRYLEISFNRLKNLEKTIYEYGQLESLDKPLNSSEDGDLLVGDSISDKLDLENEVINNMLEQDLKTELWQIVKDNTTEEENKVIKARYVDNLSLEATGKEIGQTRDRARTIEAKALRKLRRHKITRRLEERYEVSLALAFRGSVSSFNYSWESSTERAAFNIMGIN